MNLQCIAEIKARCEAATPGPWDDKVTAVYKDGTATRICGNFNRFETDAFFVAQARTDIPALVVEVERLTLEKAEETEIKEFNYEMCNQKDSEIATLKKALELATEETVETLHKLDKCGIIQITNDGTAEELADYYIQQAERGDRNASKN